MDQIKAPFTDEQVKDAYEMILVGMVCDTNEGDGTYIPYINLIEDAYLIETGSGRKNVKL